jgi:hypothetical protein
VLPVMWFSGVEFLLAVFRRGGVPEFRDGVDSQSVTLEIIAGIYNIFGMFDFFKYETLPEFYFGVVKRNVTILNKFA